MLVAFTIDPVVPVQPSQPQSPQQPSQPSTPTQVGGTIGSMDQDTPPSAPADTTPPVARVQIANITDPNDQSHPVGYYLQVWANEPLDFSQTSGVPIDHVTNAGYRVDDSSVIKVAGAKSARIFPAYFYEAFIGADAPPSADVIVKDVAGNATTISKDSVYHI
jgi:hypothetical protein